MRFGLAAALSLLVAAPAWAQEPPPPPPPDPAMQAPGTDVARSGAGTILPNMLPSRVGTTIDVRVDYSSFSGEGLIADELFLMGLNLHAQYLSPENYGAYAQIPYHYASSDADSEQGIGNIELGGLYKLPQGENSEVLLRGGIAIDTAGNEGAFLATYAQLSPRMYDAYTAGLATNWLKAEGSFRHGEGNLRLGLSLGADIPFAGDDGGLNLDALAKAAVSAGVETPGGVGFGVGVAMLHALGAGDDEDDENTIFAFNATVSFPLTPTMALYGAFGLPDLENNIDELDLFGIGAGLRVAVN